MPDPTESLNVRVTPGFKDQLDQVAADAGYANRSEFIRAVLRQAMREASGSESDRENHGAGAIDDRLATIERGETLSFEQVVDQLDLDLRPPDDRANPDDSADDRSMAVVACGGAGIRILNKFVELDPSGLETYAFDTDATDVTRSRASNPFRVGDSMIDVLRRAMDGDTDPATQETMAEFNDVVRSTIGGGDQVPEFTFLLCGLGGGSGTYLTPAVASAVADQGSTVIAFGTLPFDVEEQKARVARHGIEALADAAHTTILFDGNVDVHDPGGDQYGPAHRNMSGTVARTMLALSRWLAECDTDSDEQSIAALLRNGGISTVLSNRLRVGDIDHSTTLLTGPFIPDSFDLRTAETLLLDVLAGAAVEGHQIDTLIEYIREEYAIEPVVIRRERHEALGDELILMGLALGLSADLDSLFPGRTSSDAIDFEVMEPRPPPSMYEYGGGFEEIPPETQLYEKSVSGALPYEQTAPAATGDPTVTHPAEGEITTEDAFFWYVE